MGKQIRSLKLENYGPLTSLECPRFSNLNLVIGDNGQGKTFLLKALFASLRAAELCGRGDSGGKIGDLLASKLRWTFQSDKLGDLVTKGRNTLSLSLGTDAGSLAYSFSSSASVQINAVECDIPTSQGDSVFIPAREVVSLINVILRSREIDQAFGFDDTCYELAKLLNITSDMPASPQFGKECGEIGDIIGGKVEFDAKSQRWVYRRGNQKYSINLTADGIKKMGTVARLLSVGSLNANSVLFIDEIESGLHPTAISKMLDVIDEIANECGIQVFISSHSYFVIKKMRLLAMKREQSIPCLSIRDDGIGISDLRDGMPDNSIIQESVRLYEEEIAEVLG